MAMTRTERELLLFLGATIAGEFDQPASHTSAEIRRLLDRIGVEDRAAYSAELRPNERRFMAALEAFLAEWDDPAQHTRDAAALFREIRIVLQRRQEWGAALT